ncbi:MAG: amidase [Dehalococcoidia bacterium]
MTAPSDVAALADSLRSGERTLDQHVEALCDRIESDNPPILALLPEPDRRRRLRTEAAALEARFPEPAARPALYGLPVAIKDIFNVDGLPTRAGTAVPSELFEGPEASCVTRLKEAGALIAGKSVTTEFAYFEPGATRNPHNREHTPGGSSSGSAAAVAAGLVSLALGSQTVGSVIRPAAFCGVAGFKPSYGRIATDGVIAYSPSVDHVGAFAPDAAGLALVAAVLLDGWQTAVHDGRAGQRPVIGVPEGAYLDQAEPEGRAAFDRHVALLREAGFDVRSVDALDDIEAVSRRHRDIATAEFAEVHEQWFAQYGALYRPRTALLVEAGREVSAQEREAGRASIGELGQRLQALMDEHGIDVWASPPATGPAPLGLGSTGNPAMNLPWTHAGMPAVTLPAGTAGNGLPLGFQLSARFGADEQLLAWAQTLEPLLVGA